MNTTFGIIRSRSGLSIEMAAWLRAYNRETLEATQADKISIRTLADFRNHLDRSDTVVFIDRNDYHARRLARDPIYMTEAMRPHTVAAVGHNEIILSRGIKNLRIPLPPVSNFRAKGTNSVVCLLPPDTEGKARGLVLRIEVAGSPGAAIRSRLPESHQSLTREELDQERDDEEQDAETGRNLSETIAEEISELTDLPSPEADPRYEPLQSHMRDAIETRFAAGLKDVPSLTRAVEELSASLEFAQPTLLHHLRHKHPDNGDWRVGLVRASVEIASAARGAWCYMHICDTTTGNVTPYLVMSTGGSRRGEIFRLPDDPGTKPSFANSFDGILALDDMRARDTARIIEAIRQQASVDALAPRYLAATTPRHRD